MEGAIKTNKGVSVVYRTPDGRTLKKGFLLKQQPNWNPIGLEQSGLVIPFPVVYQNWKQAKETLQQQRLMMPNGIKLTLLTAEFREDFDHCAEVLGVPKLETARIPLAVYPEEFNNLHEIHRRRYAPFFYPDQICAGYSEKSFVYQMRLAYREN